MAGTILVREALRRSSALLGDLSPQFHRHAERQCVDALNDAALAIVTFLPSAGSRIDAIKLKPGTRQSLESVAQADVVPGDGIALTSPARGISLLHPVRNMGTNGSTPGRAVRVTGRAELDAIDPDWHLASKAAAVVREVVYDPAVPRYFYTYPPVHATTAVWLEIAWRAKPVLIPNTAPPETPAYLADGVSTVPIPIGDEYIDDLVNYVVARECMRETEWADAGKAMAFANLFLTSLNGKVLALTGVNPNLKRLPFAPEPVGAAA